MGYLDEKAELPWKETIKNQTPPPDCCVWLTAVPAAFRFFRQQEAAKRKCAAYLKSFKTRYSTVSAWRLFFFFFLSKWLSGAVGDRKSCSDPRLIEHLTPNGTDLLCALSPYGVCVCECARVHTQWYCFCWLTTTSSRKSRCGFTCWNVLFAPGNVFIDLATMTPFIEVSVLHLFFATQQRQFPDSSNVSARLIAAFCDLFQPPQIPCD